MSRSNWRLILAACGIAVAVGALFVGYGFYDSSQQQEATYRYQPASHSGFRISRVSQAPTEHYKPNCQNPYEREDADLCAQWAAVAQVQESNRLVSVNTRLAVLSFFSTIVATALLIWTFWETRQTARRELRAYIAVDPEQLTILPDEGRVEVLLKVENTGQTPAFRASWAGAVVIETDATIQQAIARTDFEAPQGTPLSQTVHAQRNKIAALRTAGPVSDEHVADAISGKGCNLFVVGRVTYEDAFGEMRWTNFCFRNKEPISLNSGTGGASTGWLALPFHNNAT